MKPTRPDYNITFHNPIFNNMHKDEKRTLPKAKEDSV